MSKFLWLAVTADEFEFPIFVEDSARKLAEKLGTHPNNVASSSSKGTSGRKTGRKIVKVRI